MKLINHLVPENFHLPFGYYPEWPYTTFGGEQRRASPSRPSRGIEIPIQFIGRTANYSPSPRSYWEELSADSEEDWDMQNCNNNASERKRLRRNRPLSSSIDKVSKKDLFSPDVIDLDFCERSSKDQKTSEIKALKPYAESNQCSSRVLRSAPLKEFRCEIDLSNDSDIENEINETDSYSVYKYLKVFLMTTGRQIDAIKGDGNCFFRALSKIIYGNQTFHDEVRQAVVDLIEKHPKKFEAFTDGPVSEHVKEMRISKTWATQTEIYAAATLLNRDIYVLSPDQSGDKYRWLLFSPRFKYKSDLLNCPCYITLCHTHGNHYDRVAPLDGKKKCNCDLEPPQLSGQQMSVDLTSDNEIV